MRLPEVTTLFVKSGMQAMPDDDLPTDAIGVVVAEFTHPEVAYEVEFCDETGAEVALRPGQFVVVA